MKSDPCQKEFDEFQKATKELQMAADRAKGFIVTEPISSIEDVPVTTKQEFDQMAQAFENEEKANKIYLEKMKALIECKQRNK